MRGVGGLWSDLADLVLPADCAGCRDAGRVAAARASAPACVDALAALRPGPVRPTPAPPACRPASPSARTQGRCGRRCWRTRSGAGTGWPARWARCSPRWWPRRSGRPRPVALVPVPDTAAAARARYGDHLARLARHAAAPAARRPAGRCAVPRPLRALPRPDSATLDSAGRAAAAAGGVPDPAGAVRGDGAAARQPTVVRARRHRHHRGHARRGEPRCCARPGCAPSVAAVLAANGKTPPVGDARVCPFHPIVYELAKVLEAVLATGGDCRANRS